MDKKKIKNIVVFILTFTLISLGGCIKKDNNIIPVEDITSDNVLDNPIEDLPMDEETDNKEEKLPSADEYIYVHVCGAVNNPGVYKFKMPVRVYEAIESAGGITSEGLDEVINQAREIADGEQIYIPTLEEKELYEAGNNAQITSLNDGRININTASKEELMTLPGVGESKANGIVEYRSSNGKFNALEELMNVEGIKDGVFNKIKDKITI